MPTSIINHVIGTVALLIMMILVGGAYIAYSGFVFKETYSSETDEVSQQIGLQVMNMVSLSKHSQGGYLVKRLEIPEIIGRFGYNVTISGGGSPPPQQSTVTNTVSCVLFNEGGGGAWTGTGNVYVSDNTYAEATAQNREVHYGCFGFSAPGSVTIVSVKVNVEHYEDPSGNRFIRFQMSTNGGSSFLATLHNLPVRAGSGSEGTDTTDVTPDTTWTPSYVNNLAVKIESQRTASGGTEYYRVDYITVVVAYVTPSVHPFQLLIYSERPLLNTANFTLPWDRSGNTLTDTTFTVPSVQNLSVLYSGVQNPVIWVYTNSTHTLFGLGKATS